MFVLTKSLGILLKKVGLSAYSDFNSPMADTTILEKCITIGPWGSSLGKEWIYIPEGFIKKIRISHDDMAIHSIEFHSQCSEGATKKSFFGCEGGKRTDTICIDYPDEYLTSISGTTGGYNFRAAVWSLCFHTNQNCYGPYGINSADATPFSVDGKGGVIVGFKFHGGFAKSIGSVGIYVMPKSLAGFDKNSSPEGDTSILEKCITLGPWGLSTGKEWSYIPEGFIKKIRISHDDMGITSIEFHSECSEGATKKSFFGGQGGKRTDTIIIDYPDEYLTSISGSYSYSKLLTSLCFHTNQDRYGAYGGDYGSSGSFSHYSKDGVIVGFHGSFGNLIRSIGLYVMPKSLAMDRNSTFQPQFKSENSVQLSRIEIPRDAGPWGASGGEAWDDGVFNNIKQVLVQIGNPSKVIFGIQFKYVKKDGNCILSQLHGGTIEDILEVEINLDGVQEYLTGISGFYGPFKGYGGLEGITSITFHTNKGKHGPYGQESGGAGYVYFKSTTPSAGKVVGFHGRSDDFLTAIGVHMEYH